LTENDAWSRFQSVLDIRMVAKSALYNLP
jgi:hypothetical protein